VNHHGARPISLLSHDTVSGPLVFAHPPIDVIRRARPLPLVLATGAQPAESQAEMPTPPASPRQPAAAASAGRGQRPDLQVTSSRRSEMPS
jgi:hypothetical protein